MKKVEYLILSDIHLGTALSQPSKVHKVLDQYSFNQLIINGDLIEEIVSPKRELTLEEYNLYNRIMAYNPWIVPGNHGNKYWAALKAQYPNLMIQDFFLIEKEISPKQVNKIIIMHGDEFDKHTNDDPKLIERLASSIYLNLAKWWPDAARWIKKKSKTILKVPETLRIAAVNHAFKNNYNVIICGHTHIPEAQRIDAWDLSYVNSGSFVDNKISFITIDENIEFVELKIEK